MGFRKTVLHTAFVSAMGAASLQATTDASAASLVINGKYQLQILTTPTATRTTAYGASETFFQIGSQSLGWNSSFTTGSQPGINFSQGMTDNTSLVDVTTDWSIKFGPGAGPGMKGTSVADGLAGLITVDVVGGIIRNATSFSVDTIFGTSAGSFAQFIQDGDLSGFSGSIDAFGNMNITPTGRLGAVDGTPGGLIGRWNIDASLGSANGPWNPFTTGSVTNSAGNVTGTACSGAGGNYACTLVSGGRIGLDWGPVPGIDYFEVWNTSMVRIGNASPVPLPAALWLFGSGLLGLLAIARQKKAA